MNQTSNMKWKEYSSKIRRESKMMKIFMSMKNIKNKNKLNKLYKIKMANKLYIFSYKVVKIIKIRLVMNKIIKYKKL